MDRPLSRSTQSGQDRRVGEAPARFSASYGRSRQNRRHRSGVLRTKRRANALPEVPRPRPVYWLWRRRSRLQDGYRQPFEMFRHVLERPWRQRHHRPTLLSPQPQVRRLLGGPVPSRLTLHIYVAHPLALSGMTTMRRPVRMAGRRQSRRKRKKLIPLNLSSSRRNTKRPSRNRTAPKYPTLLRVGACSRTGSLISGGTPLRQREPCCWKCTSSVDHRSTELSRISVRSSFGAIAADLDSPAR